MKINDKELLDLVKEKSFSEIVFFAWTKRLPNENETKMFNVMLGLSLDHGSEPPSTKAAIREWSESQDLSKSLSAGILQINDKHGGAIAPLVGLLKSDDDPERIVKNHIDNDKRVPGFGHRIYKDEDPRAKLLIDTAKELGISGTFVEKALAIEVELEKQKGKRLIINIDGALAAIACEMGFDQKLVNGIFIMPRVGGMIARTAGSAE